MNVVNNYDSLSVIDTTFNNLGTAKPTAIWNNNRGLDTGWNAYDHITAYLNIYGDTEIDSNFGTAIYNYGVLTLGTKNIIQNIVMLILENKKYLLLQQQVLIS